MSGREEPGHDAGVNERRRGTRIEHGRSLATTGRWPGDERPGPAGVGSGTKVELDDLLGLPSNGRGRHGQLPCPDLGLGVPSAGEGSRERGCAKQTRVSVTPWIGADRFRSGRLGDQGSAATWSSAGYGGRGRWGTLSLDGKQAFDLVGLQGLRVAIELSPGAVELLQVSVMALLWFAPKPLAGFLGVMGLVGVPGRAGDAGSQLKNRLASETPLRDTRSRDVINTDAPVMEVGHL